MMFFFTASEAPRVICKNALVLCKTKDNEVILEYIKKCNKRTNGQADSDGWTVIHW